MNLKSLPYTERPRERLSQYGPDALSTVELLAILLGSGTQSRSVLELAADLLSHFGSLRALAESSTVELQEVKGIGAAKAILLKAAFTLASRVEGKPAEIFLDTSEKVFHLICDELSRQKTEVLMVVLLDVRKKYIHREIISKGTLTELLVHPREVFHLAVRYRAHSVIIAHNHPSGDPSPSQKDLEMTRVLKAAGRVLGIELSDHLVIGKERYLSLKGLF
jgi:DNA repair protein RadC